MSNYLEIIEQKIKNLDYYILNYENIIEIDEKLKNIIEGILIVFIETYNKNNDTDIEILMNINIQLLSDYLYLNYFINKDLISYLNINEKVHENNYNLIKLNIEKNILLKIKKFI